MSGRQADDFFVSIISFQEQVLGWNAYIGRAKQATGLVKGYYRLQKLLTDFAQARVAPFDNAAAAEFESLRGPRMRIGTMDLRIAAIAIARGYTVLSRNLVDFRKMPGLSVEDWTQP